MNTQFWIRLVGGPRPGKRIYHEDIPWPPPEEIVVPGHVGCYKRIHYARGTPDDAINRALRGIDSSGDFIFGAEYEWQDP